MALACGELPACPLQAAGPRLPWFLTRSGSGSHRTWTPWVAAAGFAAGPLGLSPRTSGPGLGSFGPLAAARPPPVQVCPAPEAFVRPGQVPGLHPTPRTVNSSLAFEPGDVLQAGVGASVPRGGLERKRCVTRAQSSGGRGTRAPLLFVFYPRAFRCSAVVRHQNPEGGEQGWAECSFSTRKPSLGASPYQPGPAFSNRTVLIIKVEVTTLWWVLPQYNKCVPNNPCPAQNCTI